MFGKARERRRLEKEVAFEKGLHAVKQYTEAEAKEFVQGYMNNGSKKDRRFLNDLQRNG